MAECAALLAKYKILETIESGQCTIYKATDTLGRTVAIKTPGERITEEANLLEAFVDEAKTLANLNNSNIVEILAFHTPGDIDSNYYLVMEWMDHSLRDDMDMTKPTPKTVRKVLAQILNGLKALHAVDLVHRDLKPQNILVDASCQTFKLTDLGGAVGTLSDSTQYQAPEATSLQADHRSDLYSVGMIAMEMLVGADGLKRLFPEIYQIADVDKQRVRWGNWHRDRTKIAPRIDIIDPSLPQDLVELVAKLLDKNPDGRLQSADAVLEALVTPQVTIPPSPQSTEQPSTGNTGRERGQGQETPAWPFWKKALVMVLSILAVFMVVVISQPPTPDLSELSRRVDQARAEALQRGAEPGLDARLDAGDHARQEAQAALDAKHHPDASRAYERALTEYRAASATSKPQGKTEFTFEVGSTPNELRVAQALCQQQPTEACEAERFGSEAPHKVVLTPYCIDEHEVTIGEYQDFVSSHKPPDWQSTAERTGGYLRPAPGVGEQRTATRNWRTPLEDATTNTDFPVVFLTQTEAAEYCAARQSRLPSAGEWEFAARGVGRHMFPWGDEWNEEVVLGGRGDSQYGSSIALSSGATPDGLFGMAGGVREWTAGIQGAGPVLMVIKGGSFLTANPAFLRAAASETSLPQRSYDDLGFRCARDLPTWTDGRKCESSPVPPDGAVQLPAPN